MDLAYKQEATVGTLVILAFVLFFVGTTWLSGRSVGTDSDRFYRIQFRDASNLKASSPVRISGVGVECAAAALVRRQQHFAAVLLQYPNRRRMYIRKCC